VPPSPTRNDATSGTGNWSTTNAPLASSETGHSTQERAEEAAQTFERFDQARVLDVEHIGVELCERADGWTWRFVDADDEVVANSTDEFDSRRDAEAAAEALLGALESASVTVAGEPTYELYESGEEWRYRLVDERARRRARTRRDPEHDGSAGGPTSSARTPATPMSSRSKTRYEVYPATGPAPVAVPHPRRTTTSRDGRRARTRGRRRNDRRCARRGRDRSVALAARH